MEGWNATGIMGELPIIQAMLIKPEIESRSWHKNINCMLENIFSTSFLDSRKSQGHSDRLLNQGHKVVTQEHGWQLNSGHECASLNWSIYLSLIVFSLFVKESCAARMTTLSTSLSYRFPRATGLWLAPPPTAWSHGRGYALRGTKIKQYQQRSPSS